MKKYEEYKRLYDELENSIVLDSDLDDSEAVALMLYIMKESAVSVDILTSGKKRTKIRDWCMKRFS